MTPVRQRQRSLALVQLLRSGRFFLVRPGCPAPPCYASAVHVPDERCRQSPGGDAASRLQSRGVPRERRRPRDRGGRSPDDHAPVSGSLPRGLPCSPACGGCRGPTLGPRLRLNLLSRGLRPRAYLGSGSGEIAGRNPGSQPPLRRRGNRPVGVPCGERRTLGPTSCAARSPASDTPAPSPCSPGTAGPFSQWVAEHPGRQFDLVTVDGDHSDGARGPTCALGNTLVRRRLPGLR
jgi:hypothetical protein